MPSRLHCLLAAALLALPFTLGAATAPPAVGSCSTACMAEKDHCLAKLGPPAEPNCTTGMQICVERCNPRGQNTATFDAAEERNDSRSIRGASAEKDLSIRLCQQRCETASTLCPRDGLASNECGLGRQACIDRCYGK